MAANLRIGARKGLFILHILYSASHEAVSKMSRKTAIFRIFHFDKKKKQPGL